MRHWILIASYLLKDICKRWLETPGALLARLLIATLLSLLMLFLHGAFVIASHDLENRILRMGANNVYVILTRTSLNLGTGQPALDTLTAPLTAHGSVLNVRMAYSTGKTELGDDARILLYPDSALLEIDALRPEGSNASALLATNALPPGLPLQVQADALLWQATTCPLPTKMQHLADGQALLLIPDSAGASLLEFGWREICLFAADQSADVPLIVDGLEQLLRSEGFTAYNLLSARGWQEELSDLRTRQIQWQTGIALFCGALLITVFGSIAILEYRHNAYIAALIRSFGIPRSALVLRYLGEALLLVTLSGVLAHLLARVGHQSIFMLAGFDPAWLHLETLNPYGIYDNSLLLIALGVSAAASTIPIALAMRKPVGQILQ